SKSGRIITTSHKNKDGETTYHTHAEYDLTPHVSEDRHYIDLDYSLKNHIPLNNEKLKFKNTSMITVIDGKPRIIQLGHHASGNRVYLLIATANIIMPDGRFLRNRFQPIP
ncbi:MAG: hypothetical protein ACPG6P_10765, partial [Akkermansiaceae bacterium]